MRSLRNVYLAIFVVLTLAISTNAFAAHFSVFKKTYTRTTGKPKPVVDTFSVADPELKYIIQVKEEHSKRNDDTNFVIYLNGKEILKSHRCDHNSRDLKEKVTLKTNNTISVELRGKPGDGITVEIKGKNFKDKDKDGYAVEEGDCNDRNPAINPAANDLPGNGVDENCDGVDSVLVPDVVGLTETEAQLAIISAHLLVGGITSDYSDTVNLGKIISQNPQAASIVPQNSMVGFMLSLGPRASLPPDPSTIAPPVNRNGLTNFYDATSFLYTGERPIQTGVQPNAIEPHRTAVLRGKVLNQNGGPLSGVTLSVLDHPELGQTLSRADGMFDLVVNGGGDVVVKYEKEGFLSSSRQINVPWQDYVTLPDVILVLPDPKVTAVDLTSAENFQIVQGSVVADQDGERRGTVLIPQGTEASMFVPGQGSQPLTTLHIRITEYTVGPNGPQAMPAELPPNSAYTYAFDINADEALAAGATEIEFTQPLIYYVDNFLNFPAGTGAPLGFYDEKQGKWIPYDNGIVFKILSIEGGVAQLDIDGSDTPATESALAAVGITPAERQQLALLYAPGQSLMRVLFSHFSDYDINMGIFFPESAIAATTQTTADDSKSSQDPCYKTGSIIECQPQSLGESINVAGTPFELNYRSDRASGRRAAYSTKINVSKEPVPVSLKRIVLETSIAGQTTMQEFTPQDNLIVPFSWDGKDIYGRVLHQSQPVTFRVGYVYDAVYAATPRFGYNGAVALSANPARTELTIWNKATDTLGVYDARNQGLGGWSLDVVHAYDPVSFTFYGGDGSKKTVPGGEAFRNLMVSNILPQGENGSFIDIGPDGSVYYIETGFDINGSRVRRTYPDGTTITVAGGGTPETGIGDGGPATAAFINRAAGLAVSSDGTVFVAEHYTPANDMRVRRIGMDGIITTYAGGASPADGIGDGGLAINASLKDGFALAIAPDGTLYISDRGHALLRKVDPDGIISTVVGGVGPFSIDFGVDGSVYFSSQLRSRLPEIYRLYPSGVLERVAARDCQPTEPKCYQFDNSEFPLGIAIAQDQSIYFAANGETAWSNFIYRLDNNFLTKVAGSDLRDNPLREGISNQVGIFPNDLDFDPKGNLYFSNPSLGTLQKISSVFPGFQVGLTPIPSEDGAELYVFDASGRHLKTLSTLTGTVLYQFAYTSDGLSSITDRDGNVTVIERDGSGKPTAIVSPFGKRTVLRTDANGYLDRVTQPNGDTYQLVTSANGLLTQFINPRNNASKFAYDASGRLVKDDNPLNTIYTLSREIIPDGAKVILKDALNRTTVYESKFFENGEEQRLNTASDGTQSSLVIRPDYSLSSASADGTTMDLVRAADARFGIQSPLIKSQTIRTPGGLAATVSTTRSTNLSNPDDLLSVVNQTENLTINGNNYSTYTDIVSRTSSTSSPEGRFAVSIFDNLEHIVKQQMGVFEPVHYTYDARGRLTRSTQGSGPQQRTLTLTYNAEGYLNDATNALNEKVSFIYDLKGRVLKQTLPDGRFVQYEYDGNDNVISITPAGRPKHQFVYSTVDLVENYNPPVVVGGGQTTYLYNPAKQLKVITRPDGQLINYDYDTAGRMSTMTTPRGTTTYSYNPTTGDLASLTAPDGGSLQYAYDGFLLLSETWNGTIQGSVSQSYNNDFRIVTQSINGSSTVNFGYDKDGLLNQVGALNIQREGSVGLLTRATLGNLVSTFTYNNFAELSTDTAAYIGVTYLDHQYIYDKVGRIASRTETDQSTTDQYQYTYDTAGRLTDVKKNGTTYSHYEYDANGNRLSRSASGVTESGTYDAQDRLLTYGNFTYTYTANGELKSKTDISLAQTTQYNYDVLGNLLKVTLPNGTVIDYIIDGNNRRIGKKVNGTLVQGFLYEDDLSPVAELDGSNNVVSRFIYGTKGHVPDYFEKGGKTYRIITDHLGSVRMVVDTSDGNVAQRIDYDEFGRILTDTNPGFQPFGFAGGIYDSSTGLTRFGARDYDAIPGRWTAKDPIGFEGGDTNLYGYVVNDPVNLLDPWGEDIMLPGLPGYLPPTYVPPTYLPPVNLPPIVLPPTYRPEVPDLPRFENDPCDKSRPQISMHKSDGKNETPPGKPTEKDGYKPPKKGNGKKVKNPNGKGSGYLDEKGNVWIPTDHKGTHAPHWDVQHPGGGHTNVYP